MILRELLSVVLRAAIVDTNSQWPQIRKYMLQDYVRHPINVPFIEVKLVNIFKFVKPSMI